MRLLVVILLLQCMVTKKDNSFLSPTRTPNGKEKKSNSVFLVLNQEIYKNGDKSYSEDSYYILLSQIQDSKNFSSIQKEVTQADLILEIEIQTRRESNRILPFLSVISFSLIPYYQSIKLEEKFRLIRKNGEIIFNTSRIQNLGYWFGFLFIIPGIIQSTNTEDHNRFGFEKEWIERMNENILEELKKSKSDF